MSIEDMNDAYKHCIGPSPRGVLFPKDATTVSFDADANKERILENKNKFVRKKHGQTKKTLVEKMVEQLLNVK